MGIQVDNYLIKAQIWDTAGQPRFRAITSTYYRDVDGVIIVFDVTKKGIFIFIFHIIWIFYYLETFYGLTDWLAEVNHFSGSNPAIILIGTY